MAYFQTDDAPSYHIANPRSLLKLISPNGVTILDGVQSRFIKDYYKANHAPIGCNGKKVWRQKLTELGYKIQNQND